MPKLKQNMGRMGQALRRMMGDVRETSGSAVHAIHEYPSPEVIQGPCEPLHPDVRFEESDIDSRGVTITGYSVLAGALIATVLLYFVFTAFANHRAAVSPPPLPMDAHGTPLPPEPRLQEFPRRDLAGQRTFEDSVLNKYWWADRQHGEVGIPIERAMAMVASRGIPPQRAPDDLKLFPPHTGDRGVGFTGRVAPEVP